MSLPLLTSRVIPAGFRHGFTSRAGGVSGRPYASLNVGLKWGDNPEHVHENRRRVQQAAGAERMFFVQQVHGAAVAFVQPESTPQDLALVQADALVVQRVGFAVAVMVADCVPLLLADPTTGACAAVHAGWRGTVADVAGAAVRALVQQTRSDPAQFCAAVGPSIGPCCFEVGAEVVEGLKSVVPGPPSWLLPREKPHVDLWLANQALLQAAGLPPQNIEVLGACTHCDPGRFFSYRREGAATGQMLGFISSSA